MGPQLHTQGLIDQHIVKQHMVVQSHAEVLNLNTNFGWNKTQFITHLVSSMKEFNLCPKSSERLPKLISRLRSSPIWAQSSTLCSRLLAVRHGRETEFLPAECRQKWCVPFPCSAHHALSSSEVSWEGRCWMCHDPSSLSHRLEHPFLTFCELDIGFHWDVYGLAASITQICVEERPPCQ